MGSSEPFSSGQLGVEEGKRHASHRLKPQEAKGTQLGRRAGGQTKGRYTFHLRSRFNQFSSLAGSSNNDKAKMKKVEANPTAYNLKVISY